MPLKILRKDGSVKHVTQAPETGSAMMDSFKDWQEVYDIIAALGEDWIWSLERDITAAGYKGYAVLKHKKNGIDFYEMADTPLKALRLCLQKAGKLPA